MKNIMEKLGAKQNGAEYSFIVGPKFFKNAAWIMSAIIAVSVFIARAASVYPRLCELETRVVKVERSADRTETKIDTMSEQLKELRQDVRELIKR